MSRIRVLALLAVVGFASGFARAATVDVQGPNGGNGATGATGVPDPNVPYVCFGGTGGNGQDGAPASAVASAPDPANGATATGGSGGLGGKGGAAAPVALGQGGNGGSGGNGGAAQATATTSGAFSSATANALAQGGSGGAGGMGGAGAPDYIDGSPGHGGSGGRADSLAQATSTAGAASAISSATGGNGAAGGPQINQPQEPFTSPIGDSAFVGPGGVGGDASATSQATATGDADAQARAFAGPQGTANTSATVGASATANATAASQTGNATATAEATGGAAIRGDTLTDVPGVGSATARATSVSGNATAIARNIAGRPANGFSGSLVADPEFPGGPGGSASAVDAVSGSAGGLLTLIQEARASGVSGPGAGAASTLHAANPGGGSLLAQSIANGGAQGGAATATTEATVLNSARVEADATANAAFTSDAVPCGIYDCGVQYGTGGNADARAKASGRGEVVAQANATALNAPTTHLASEASTVGPISRAAVSLDLHTPMDGTQAYFGVDPMQFSVSGATRAAVGSAALLPAAPTRGNGEANLFAVPSASDVATWTQGGAHVADALQNGRALGLGSLSAGGRNTHVDMEYTGSLELDLTNAELDASHHLALAFMDPTSAGSGIDLLHLQLSRGSQTVFDRSFSDSASAITALDDGVFQLGALLASGSDTTPLVLSFDVGFGADPDAAFALRLALLDSTVPEPALALLALGGLLACLAPQARQRGGASR